LESEVEKVATAPEGERNNGLFKAACRAGELVGAGALEREVVAEALAAATTLPAAEASATIRNGLERGMACPRDLSRVHRNGDGAEPVNEDLADPHRLARLFRDTYCLHADGTHTLRFWQGDWMQWGEGFYRCIQDHELHARLAYFCKEEFNRANLEAIAAWEEAGGVDSKGNPRPAPKCCKVSKTLVVNVALALGGYELLDGRTEDPSWLIEDPPFPAHEILPCKNFLVHLPSWVAGGGSAAVREPHPNLFARHALDYDFDPEAPEPVEWLHFLGSKTIPDHPGVHQLWPDDRESVAALQEWLGYLLVPDVSQHKILLLVGPTRCGKGTIARVVQALVGIANVANPTLSGLGTQFGLQPLVGKMVAIIADARMSGRSDMAQITENLLSISGEDTRTVDRKHKTSITTKLTTRFLMLSNQIPRLVDESGALANRFIILKMTRDFLGREDHDLTNRLLAELPGILLWAIAGWRRLKERGYFLQPKSGQDDVELMHDSSSPVGAFLRESCVLGPEHTIAIADLYDAWKTWCLSKGREKYTGDEHTFGRNLNAACPTVTVTRPRSEGSRKRHYQGIALLPPNAATDATPF
jgi:putative DNA primase/helicase